MPSGTLRASTDDPRWDRVAWIAIATGLALQTWLWSRAWLFEDQIVLLLRGMELALSGELAPFAKQMSGGGLIPGATLQLAVGLPLLVWFDYRSPAVLLGLFQLAACLILWRTISDALDRRTAALFVLVYWWAPWRLYHSGFIWEPTYLLLPAAAHLWACWRQRSGPEFLPSMVLALTIVLGGQLHASSFVLLLLTLGLWLVRRLKVHWTGLLTGVAIGALPLIPTVRALLGGAIPGAGDGGGGLREIGFVKLFPLVKTVAYWLRLGSLDVGRRLSQTVFLSGGEGGSELLTGTAWVFSVVGFASVLVTLFANGSVFLRWRRTTGPEEAERNWLLSYAALGLLALLLGVGVSTITVQSWHQLVLLHAMCVPLALWLGDRLPTAGRLLSAVLLLFLVLRIPLAILLGVGHPMYRIPDDPVQRARVAPRNLPRIEIEEIPFGKEVRKAREAERARRSEEP